MQTRDVQLQYCYTFELDLPPPQRVQRRGNQISSEMSTPGNNTAPQRVQQEQKSEIQPQKCP